MLHVFVDFNFRRALDIIQSLIKQLLGYLVKYNSSCPLNVRDSIEVYFGLQSQPGEITELIRDVLQPLLQAVDFVYIVLDGLDECESSEATDLLEALNHLVEWNKMRLLVSGRESLSVNNVILKTQRIWIASNDASRDIKTLTDALIGFKSRQRKLVDDEDSMIRVREVLCNNAQGM